MTPSSGNAKSKPRGEKSGTRREAKLLGVAGAARQARGSKTHSNKGVEPPEHIIFEGKRASVSDLDGLSKRHKAKKSVTGKRLKGKRAQRVKDWKKAGGMKKA